MTTPFGQPDDGQSGQAASKLVDHEAQAPTPEEPAPPRSWRNWLQSPVVQGLLALGIYLVIWASTSARPLAHHLSKAQLDQASMDPNFYVWCLRWWPYAIGHGLNPMFSHQIGAPAGHSLAWVTTVPPIALLAAPLTLAAGPVVSFNLLAVVALPLSAWAAFVLCRRLTQRFWASLVGGAVFGFSAYEMNHGAAGQLNLTFSLLLPILAYFVVLWRDESISARTFVILTGITMAVQFYLFLETFADMTAILAVALVIGFAVAGRSGRPAVLRLGKLFGLAYAISLALAAPYLAYALTTPSPKLSAVSGLDLASLVIPRPDRTLGASWLAHAAAEPIHTSAAGYVGLPLLILAVLLGVTGWSSKIIRFLSCMLVFVVVAALGTSVYVEGHRLFDLPWARLWSLPIVRNAYPSRLMLFAYLVLAVATALWLAGPAKRLWTRWPLGLLVIAALVLDTPTISTERHSTVPSFISNGTYRRELSPGETVVVVSKVGNAGMLWQAHSDFYTRLAGGYINQAITRRTDLPRIVQDLANASPLRVRKFEAYVRSARIGAILLDYYREPKWVGIFWRIGLKGHLVDGVVVYKTDGCRSCRVLNSAQLVQGRT
jgi:hypothetical protein